ncbi:PREDICTED: uncharacterized protein LOC103337931 [Prunus mume]|uniref:Uncharacterized protein LOC103337931 n=1 Tax=Prunus mume TaxID=102107 RepID=A0ABM1LVF9_PRUMU|nr:PREDICTED: uncharacterized protein LOC103337931 [Prunus mume]
MDQHKTKKPLKLLCSYGGKILPRHTDGNLRYVGGLTRVLAVDASISFAELMVKLAEFCGYSVDLRCQLPDGDLETLISVKSDEELANIIEEYDRASSSSRPLKIRAILSPPKSLKQISPPMSMATSGGDLSPSKSLLSFTDSPPKRYVSPLKGYVSPPKRYASPPIVHPGPVRFQKGSGRACYYPCHVQSNPSDMSDIPHHHHHHQHRHQHVPHCNDWR